MAEITAAMVKELREITGAGMMDCKKALNETGGNMDEAVEVLRKSGQAKAVKKEGRIAAEGNLLNMRLYTDASIAYVTCGQNVPDDIEVFNPQTTVKKLLGGGKQ